jgi:hypothetical protein
MLKFQANYLEPISSRWAKWDKSSSVESFLETILFKGKHFQHQYVKFTY